MQKVYWCSSLVALPSHSTAFFLLMEMNRSDFLKKHWADAFVVLSGHYKLCDLLVKLVTLALFFVLTSLSPTAVGAGVAGTGSAAESAGWLSNRCLSIGWSSSWCSSTPSPYHQSIITSLCGWRKCRVWLTLSYSWKSYSKATKCGFSLIIVPNYSVYLFVDVLNIPLKLPTLIQLKSWIIFKYSLFCAVII